MCLEGVAGPPSAWLSLWVGVGAVASQDTTNAVAEEGVVSGVGHVQTAIGVVEDTSANKAKKSVTWMSSEGDTTGWASVCADSCTQVADGDKGEYYVPAVDG